MQLRNRVAKNSVDIPEVRKRSYAKKKFISIMNEINFNLAKHLKDSSSSTRTFKICINSTFANYLLKEYGVKQRYLKCQQFLRDHPVEKSNQVDKNNRYFIDETTFSIKICNKRSRVINGINGHKKFAGYQSLAIKFTRKVEHKFDEAAKNILKNFYSKN